MKTIAALSFICLHSLTCAFVALEGIIETAEEDENYRAIEVSLMSDKIAGGKLKSGYYRIF